MAETDPIAYYHAKARRLADLMEEVRELRERLPETAQFTDPADRYGDPLRAHLFARLAVEGRKHRNRIFGDILFGEPRWDMLLALYIAETDDGSIAESELIEGSGVPDATACRHLKALVQAHHVHALQRDGVVRLQLTTLGRNRMDLVFGRAMKKDSQGTSR